jgi:hypothetical protein
MLYQSPGLLSRLPPSYMPEAGSRKISPPPAYRASVQEPTSLDLSQRFERKLAEYNASQNILKRWLFEIISLAISTICMVGGLSFTAATYNSRDEGHHIATETARSPDLPQRHLNELAFRRMRQEAVLGKKGFLDRC